MDNNIKIKLTAFVEKKQIKNDPSHDFQHVIRVMNVAAKIGKDVDADLDIIIPAALFHDIVVYKKNSLKSRNAANESASVARKILSSINEYPKEKIEKVEICIKECSFSKGITPELIESKVLQDADRLEATGAISIMRTFASAGQMNIPFYDFQDPFCESGATHFRSAIDLFYKRLLIVGENMHTDIAARMAKQRTEFLKNFLSQLKNELEESEIIDATQAPHL